MSGRFSEPIPKKELVSNTWTLNLGRRLWLWMQSIELGMGGLQGTPADPSTIQAHVSGDKGIKQSAAKSDHVHPVETAAPAYVKLGGTPADGTGTALVSADATFVLEQGGASDGQSLVWDATTNSWKPSNKPAILAWLLRG